MLKTLARSELIRYIGLVVALAALCLSLISIGVWFNYGSIALALGHLDEKTIAIAEPIASIGAVEAGRVYEVKFDLVNETKRPVHILGSNTTCSCTTAQPLPEVVAPSSRTTMKFSYKPASGEVEPIHMVLYTDDPRKPELAMVIVPQSQGTASPERATDHP